MLIYALIGVSLTMLVGWAGQVSLGQFALVGIGAYVTAKWAGQAGWSMVELLVVAGLVGAVVMVVIGLPALRVRGLTLAVTTLGLAVIAPDWLYQQGWLGGSTPFNEPVQAMTILARSRINRLDERRSLRGARRARPGRRGCGNPAAIGGGSDHHRGPGTMKGPSWSFGIKPVTVKLRVLALSGFVAAAAGVFFAADWQSVTPTYFDADFSIVPAIPVVGGLGSLGGAVAAGTALHGHLLHRAGCEQPVGLNWPERGFLLALGWAGCHRLHDAVPQRHRRRGPRAVAGVSQQKGSTSHDPRTAIRQQAPAASNGDRSVSASGSAIERAAAGVSFATIERHENGPRKGRSTNTAPLAGAPPLAVDHVAIRFGGVDALADVAIEVGAGEIVGLIGPNGEGKHDDEHHQRSASSGSRFNTAVRPRGCPAVSGYPGPLWAGAELPGCLPLRRADGDQDRPGRNIVAGQDISPPGDGGRARVRSAERSSRQRALEIEAFGLGPVGRRADF